MTDIPDFDIRMSGDVRSVIAMQNFDAMLSDHMRVFQAQREEQIRAQLIELGWTPPEARPWQWGIRTSNGDVWSCTSREEAEEKVEEWNTKAARWRREEPGRASYPSWFLTRRRTAIDAGRWEAP